MGTNIGYSVAPPGVINGKGTLQPTSNLDMINEPTILAILTLLLFTNPDAPKYCKTHVWIVNCQFC